MKNAQLLLVKQNTQVKKPSILQYMYIQYSLTASTLINISIVYFGGTNFVYFKFHWIPNTELVFDICTWYQHFTLTYITLVHWIECIIIDSFDFIRCNLICSNWLRFILIIFNCIQFNTILFNTTFIFNHLHFYLFNFIRRKLI